jgi:hypothetical protein
MNNSNNTSPKQNSIYTKLGKYAVLCNEMEWDNKDKDYINDKYSEYITRYAKLLNKKGNTTMNKNDKNMCILDSFKTLLYLEDKFRYSDLYGNLNLSPFVLLNFPDIEKHNFKLCIRDLNLLKKSMGIYYKNNGKNLLVNKKILRDIVDRLYSKLRNIKLDNERYNFIPQKKDVLKQLKYKIDKVDNINETFSKYFNSKIKYTCCNSILEIRERVWF